MSECGRGIITGVSGDHKAALGTRCKSAHCTNCNVITARKLRARCYAAQCNIGFDLTIRHEEGRSLEEEVFLLKRTWRRFRNWWNRKHPNAKIICLTVWECKGPRHVHMHVLARSPYVPWQILQRFFWKEIRSHKQWPKPLTNKKKRIAYATKYITKQLIKLPHTSRWSVSHKFTEPYDPPPMDAFFQGMEWTYKAGTLPQYAHDWLSRGFRVDLDLDKDYCLVRPP